MAQRQPEHALHDFKRTLRDCERLSMDAGKWSAPGSQPHISRKRAESMIELAYLRSYLAWEVFLEESFLLYMVGLKAPRRPAPTRYAFPPNRSFAREWLREGRDYAKWDAPNVVNRAGRYFRSGIPFQVPLRSRQTALQDAKTIRNALAHESDKAWTQFTALARNQLGGSLPPGMTVGRFLNSLKPSATPPITFLEFYLEIFEAVADDIVPV
jgi:hypothetical protein